MAIKNTDPTFLQHHFLIAMPETTSAPFLDALIYICDHTEEGAMGVIVNYPLDLTLKDMLDKMNIKPDLTTRGTQSIYYGGPIDATRGFVLHRPCGQWYATLSLNKALSITTSRDILEAMALDKDPHENMVFLGYLSWQSGQLEAEMADNLWLSTPADLSILFQTPYQERRHAAARLLGVNLNQLSRDAGHA
ncbi:MAG: hypothetical protein K0R12_942 [Gammaproteobacteria bacterium]|jgi:putative transcriptional regulator|nr:hypothetical protein [Gammaproteobacteria bacterium]